MTAPATAAERGGGGGASGRGSGSPQEGSEAITRRMVAELKGLHQPSREVGDILEAVLMVIDPQASYTWDEARKWLSDSRRFLKALQRATPGDVTPDTVRRLSAFVRRDYSGTHPTAFALAKWVVSLCERSADAGASTPARRLLPDGSPARGAKQRGVANVSSACVVLGACSALPALRLTATTAAVLQRSAKLWTQWSPVEGLPVYSFDHCVWGAKRELEMPVASAQSVYEQTAKRLVDSSREGVPSCLCLIGPASALYVYECFEHLLVDIAGGSGGDTDADADAGVAVSVLDVKDGIVRDAITDEETDGPEFLRDVRVVHTAQDLAALLEASPCHGSRVMSLAAASSPTLANPLCVAELDMTDSAGLTSVHSWAVAARTGGSRLATHPLQRIAAAAFGLRGNVMLLAALPTTVAEAAAARAMHYTHLAVHEAEPWPDANKADAADGNDEAGYGNPLDEARQDLNAIRKVALSQFRAIEPSPPVQAATMASLLCLGISTTSWDGCRTALCAPGLMRRLKEHEDVVTLLEADYRRLRALLRRCEALPLGATDSAEVVACGMALAQWASAAFAAGLVRQKKTRSVKDSRLPPPTLHSDSPALHDNDDDRDDVATVVTAATAAAAAATATEAASAADELATAADHADAESSVAVSEPAAPPPPPTRARAASVAASSVAVGGGGGGGGGAPSGAPTPALSALPLPLPPAEDATALPHAEGDEGAEALVGPLLARVSELEAELADKERLLVLLRHREEREEAARHKQGLSPPPPPPPRQQQATTPRGSAGNGAVRRQPPPPPLPPPAQAPRQERQQVTAAQTQQLRLKSWAAFVRTARREIGEAELLKVSYDMLHKLIRLYKLDRTPVEACRVELYWKEHNWKGEESFIPPVETRADRAQSTPRQKRTAVEGRDPRRCMHSPNAGPPRLPQPRSPPQPSSSSPAPAPANAATSAAHQRPPKSPRAPKVAARAQPIPQTPDTPGAEKRRGRGAGGASPQRQRQGPPPPPATPASASVRTPASPGSGRRGVHMTEIGELEQDAAVRRRDAPVGHADPNRMMAEHLRFNGASDEAAQLEVRRELCPYGSRAVLADPNAPSPAPKPRSLVRHTPAAASPADPNDTNAHASPKPTQRAMLPAQPAASCNPNPELGPTHHTDIHCAPAKESVGRALETGPRKQQLRQEPSSSSNPNDVSIGKDTVRTWSPRAGAAPAKASGSDPNTALGEDALQRHLKAQTLDRAEGNKVFRDTGRTGCGSDPNAVSSGSAVVGSGYGHRRPVVPQHADAAALDADEAASCKRRVVEAPGTRHGEAAHPILGSDAVQFYNDSPLPQKAAASLSRTAELGIVRAELSSDQQHVPSPASRRRHIQPSTLGLIG